VVICPERVADCLNIVQLMPLPSPSSLAFLAPAYPGCPGKVTIKLV